MQQCEIANRHHNIIMYMKTRYYFEICNDFKISFERWMVKCERKKVGF